MTGEKQDIQKPKRKVQAPPSDTVASSPLLEEAAAEPGHLQPPAASRQPAEGIPVVGIGASAGGLAAFEAFFSGMPADTDPGMAFVLVQHLAPGMRCPITRPMRSAHEAAARVLLLSSWHEFAGRR